MFNWNLWVFNFVLLPLGLGSYLVKVVEECPEWKPNLYLCTQAKGVTGAHTHQALWLPPWAFEGPGQDTHYHSLYLGPRRKEFALGPARLRSSLSRGLLVPATAVFLYADTFS